MGATLRILCLGDIVGRPGRSGIKRCCQELKSKYGFDLLIANAENSAGGVGCDSGTAAELIACGIDVITLGDHAWQRREFRDYLNTNSAYCIRPANYPVTAPGRGWAIITHDDVKIGVMNLIGRVFLNNLLECPFRTADDLLAQELKECTVLICDFHAEATSEKIAMGAYLDGRVSLVFGTHTHVQTADEQILSEGTGYITDLGMCGSSAGIIGMDTNVALERLLNGMPVPYKTAKGNVLLCGVIVDIDTSSGEAVQIERVRYPVSE